MSDMATWDLYSEPCTACGAEAGEPCRPMCLGMAAEADARDMTSAELLELQTVLSRAYLRRMDIANGYLCWPPDGLASELDELASDIAFERHGWLAPVPF